MGGSDIEAFGISDLCNNPAHAEPYACWREAEGGWVCDAELEGDQYKKDLEKSQFIAGYLYDALGPANDDIWAMAEEAWKELHESR